MGNSTYRISCWGKRDERLCKILTL